MENPTDVDRMFSWLKTPQLKYREFEGAKEVTEAVSSWPLLHQVAGDSGRVGSARAPFRDEAIRERAYRDSTPSVRQDEPELDPRYAARFTTRPTRSETPVPAAPEFAVTREELVAQDEILRREMLAARPRRSEPRRPEPARAAASGGLMSILGRRLEAKRRERSGQPPLDSFPAAATAGTPPAARIAASAPNQDSADRQSARRPEDPFGDYSSADSGPDLDRRFTDEAQRRAEAVDEADRNAVGRDPSRDQLQQGDADHRPAADHRSDRRGGSRGTLFGGAYRNEGRSEMPRENSLRSVFDRLASDEEPTPPPPRGRRPGLDPVFGRLR